MKSSFSRKCHHHHHDTGMADSSITIDVTDVLVPRAAMQTTLQGLAVSMSIDNHYNFSFIFC